ncbi:MAG: LCP family protein [Coriobacteriales bacterium]|nr:LCP family protein [Coriobacteriales bacterium]
MTERYNRQSNNQNSYSQDSYSQYSWDDEFDDRPSAQRQPRTSRTSTSARSSTASRTTTSSRTRQQANDTSQNTTRGTRSRSSSAYANTGSAPSNKKRLIIIIASVIGAIVLIAAIVVASFMGSIGCRLNEQYRNDQELQNVLNENQQRAQQNYQASVQDQKSTELQSNWSDMTPFYMLLVGVDSSDDRMYGDEGSEMGYGSDEGSYRTDTIILARIDPGNKKVALVSIHRDTLYPINGREQKINNAYSIGGMAKTIEVISEFAGVPITHFAQVNMDGFAAIIDALGGLEINVPFEIYDDWTDAYFPAGPQILNGHDATYYVRIRHAYDQMGDGDRYRAAAQRQVLEVLLQRIMSASPVEMVNIINTLAGYASTDFTLDQIVNLALAMRGIDINSDVYSTMNPTIATYTNDTWYEISDTEAWNHMMAMVDAGQRPSSDTAIQSGLGSVTTGAPGTVELPTPTQANTDIYVKDAYAGGLGSAEATQALVENGWRATDAGVANISLDYTVVVYQNDTYLELAAQIAEIVGGYTEPRLDTWGIPDGYGIMVVMGTDIPYGY